MKNLFEIKNASKAQIIDIKTLQSMKGGQSDPPPFGTMDNGLQSDPPPFGRTELGLQTDPPPFGCTHCD